MNITRSLFLLASVATFSSCGLGGKDENYDTGGYDTSDPYGVPNSSGVESATYQPVNPPAEANPTYSPAAYEDAAPSIPPAPAVAPAVASTHTVAKGDTLWGLSRQYNVSVDAIRAANGMAADDNTVRLGQSINIPAR